MLPVRGDPPVVTALRSHGGPDARGAARHDFSTCANPLGPCPLVVERLGRTDVGRYPDPMSSALRERLAAFHGVAAARVRRRRRAFLFYLPPSAAPESRPLLST